MKNTKLVDAVLLDNIYYSVGFPDLDIDDLIERSNYLIEMDNAFKQGIDLIFIEGNEDSGKSTLCALYAKKQKEFAISIFFNPQHELDYNISFFCTNFINQAKSILGEENINESGYYGIEEYRKYSFPLRKFLNKNRKKITLIIDGIEGKVDETNSFFKELMGAIPFGEKTFQIVISGKESLFKKAHAKLKKSQTKSLNLTGFSKPEIKDYLGLHNIENDKLTDLLIITKGLPGRLKTLKRRIKDEGLKVDDISKSISYKQWIELDCSSINLEISVNKAVISLLALTGKSYSIEEIAKICTEDIKVIENFINQNPIFEKVANNIRFVSNSHKDFFSNLLRGKKKKVDEMLIQHYASDDSINSLIELPKLHARSMEWLKVIDVLDENYLPRIVENTGSLEVVNESLKLGIKASKITNKHSELWRYSIQGSIVNELDNYQFWESEILARIALHDFAGAITLAESAVLKFDRLRLLALIAKKQKQVKNLVDEDLVKLILDLYDTVDLYAVGDKIYDIVADLLYAIPNLAIEIIEKSSNTSEDSDINDWIIAKLSLAAIDSSDKEKEEKIDSRKMEAIQNLNNKSVKKINKAIAFLVGNYSIKKVIAEVNKLQESNEKLRLLRLWLNNNKASIKDIQLVIDLALDEIIKSSSRENLTYSTLKDFSRTLPYIKDQEIKRNLLDRFMTIERSLINIKITRNKYIYQLNIFHTEFDLCVPNWRSKINKIVSEIDSIQDPIIRLDSFSEVYSKLKTIRNVDIKKTNGFVYAKILNLTKELFNVTANHYRISSYLLKTIGKKNPILGLKICSQINTANRREKGKLLVLATYLDNNLRFVKIDLLKEIENSMEYKSSRVQLCLDILERYSEAKSLHFNIIKNLLFFSSQIDAFGDAEDRLFGYILEYKILVKNSEWKNRLSLRQQNKIYDTWQSIETEWNKIDSGFTISSDLAEIDPIFANRVFEESKQLKNQSWIDSKLIAHTYIISIKVIIKSFGALLLAKQNKEEHLNSLKTLINRIPSEKEKLELWVEIGFNSIIAKNDQLALSILEDHVIPILVSLNSKKFPLKKISYALIYLYLFNPDMSKNYIDKIDNEKQSQIFNRISYWYLSKRNPFDFYESGIFKYRCTFNEISLAISTLKKINLDRHIYSTIRHLCEAIKETKKSLSPTQISTFYESIEKIILSKLPDFDNVKHEGYKILSEARLSTIKTRGINHQTHWNNLLSRVKQIENISDRVLMITSLLEIIPFEKINIGRNQKEELFDLVIIDLGDLKIKYEYVQRVIDITDIMYKYKKAKWTPIVDEAFKMTFKFQNNREVFFSQKKIIDVIYKLDPKYAKKLMNTIDKDNEENKLNQLLKEHYESLVISNKIKNNQELIEKEKNGSRLVVKAVVSALESLNSEKITPKKLNEITHYLAIGNNLPLHEKFPIYLYYLTNCAKTYHANKLTGNVKDIHVKNFQEAIKATELIRLLSHKRKEIDKTSRRQFIDNEFSGNIALTPNSREEAIGYIKAWLSENATDFLIIADPYFQKEDLEILKWIKETCDNKIEVDVLGSKNGMNLELESNFENYWKKISDESAPFTNFTFCWIPEKGNDTPFHDRWIITKDGGIRLGTSINSMGLQKNSELSIMKPTDALTIKESFLTEYISRKKRMQNNQQLKYRAFNLN